MGHYPSLLGQHEGDAGEQDQSQDYLDNVIDPIIKEVSEGYTQEVPSPEDTSQTTRCRRIVRSTQRYTEGMEQ